MNEEIKPKCEDRFKKIEDRLAQGDKKFVELGIKIDNLISSQNTLTKACWGVVSAILITLVSFVLGKI